VPLRTINARQRRPNSYESDRYTVVTYKNFVVGPPKQSVFDLPSNWVQLYRNFNNGFHVERSAGDSYSVVSPGTTLKMLVYLRTVPQQGLGAVSVNVYTQPDANANCTTCISWSPSSFNFDTTNWRTPQTLTITYIGNGTQKLNLASFGGGYDYVSSTSDVSYFLTIVSCEGTTGSYCDSWNYKPTPPPPAV
jgi:hypothetical protein